MKGLLNDIFVYLKENDFLSVSVNELTVVKMEYQESRSLKKFNEENQIKNNFTYVEKVTTQKQCEFLS